MDVEEKREEIYQYKRKKIGMDENPLDRGLFIPLIKNETKQERANRILSMMEESNDH